MNKDYKKVFFIIFIAVLLDQVIKILVINNLNLYENIPVIKNFFHLNLIHNIGAAFSILSGQILFLILISVFVLIILFNDIIKDNNHVLAKSILISGIIGNLIDRVFRGYVIDYISITVFKYTFPIFNVADIYIVLSIIILIIYSFKEDICKR